MANYPNMVDKNLLGVFLDEIKTKFPVSVNNNKPDSKGNISLPTFGGSSSSNNGSSGLVPAPKMGEQNKVLKADGTWYDILKFISDNYQAKEAGKGLSTNDFTTALLNKLNGIGAGANGLGIIASNLAQNGYVKFANGLILQWGYYLESTYATDYRYYPIPFTKHCTVFTSKSYMDVNEPNINVSWVYRTDLRCFSCGIGDNYIGNTYMPIFAIGV